MIMTLWTLRSPELWPQRISKLIILFQGCHDNDALDIAFSGAVASVAHVDGIHVHVACCGDVQAVLGSLEVSHLLIDSEMLITALLSKTTEIEEMAVGRMAL